MKIRKDKTPSETIKLINNILNKQEIAVSETEIIQYSNFWASVRVELQGLSEVGTNGKGGNIETARASAYGELMERLQGGFLIDRLFKKCNSRKANQVFSYEDFISAMESIGFSKEIMRPEWMQKIYSKDYLREKSVFYNILEGYYVDLPNWFIETNCGTNGLCAGNSKAEALLQGINEIQERYMRKRFFEGQLDVYDIGIEEFKDLDSYKLLQLVEEKGYRCYVKDFTEGGKYPVLGLVILDSSRNSYMVSMGADYDLDICLQRCITEIFQGKDFPMLFKCKMINIFNKDNFYLKCDKLERNKHYQNNVLNGIGAYPYGIFEKKENNGSYRNAFVIGGKTNEELLAIALTNLSRENRKIYVKDNSILGFPAYRVYIKGISELCNVAYSVLENDDNFDFFDRIFYKLRESDNDDIKTLIDVCIKLLDVPFYTEENLLNVLTGIPFEMKWLGLDIGNIWMFCALCSWRLHEYSNALEFLERYSERYKGVSFLPSNYKAFYVCLKYLNVGKSIVEASTACEGLDTDDFIIKLGSLQQKMDIYPTCPECMKCGWKEQCCYDEWYKIAFGKHKRVQND